MIDIRPITLALAIGIPTIVALVSIFFNIMSHHEVRRWKGISDNYRMASNNWRERSKQSER